MQRRTLLKQTLVAGAAALAWTGASAQTSAYPNKPITIVVSGAAGGQSDIVARFLADGLTRALGQPVIVDNKAGASGIVGLQYAARRPADGYTLVYGTASWNAINPGFFPTLPYDQERDFTGVSQLGIAPQALLVGAHVPARTLAEFIALAKSKPGKLSFASFGNGSTSHLQGELLKQSAGIDMLHVPFKGSAPALQEVIAGRVDAFIIDFAPSGAFVRDGKLRALALTGTTRSPEFPDVKTFQELGSPLTMVGWNGIFTNAGTPKEVVTLLNQKLNAIILSPDGKQKLEQFGLLPTGITPDAFNKIVREDIAKWRDVVQRAGIKPD